MENIDFNSEQKIVNGEINYQDNPYRGKNIYQTLNGPMIPGENNVNTYNNSTNQINNQNSSNNHIQANVELHSFDAIEPQKNTKLEYLPGLNELAEVESNKNNIAENVSQPGNPITHYPSLNTINQNSSNAVNNPPTILQNQNVGDASQGVATVDF